MGIFNFFKKPKMDAKLRKAMEQERQRQAQYLLMTAEALSRLPDSELVYAAFLRIQQQMKVGNATALSDEQCAVYVLFELDSEVNNGGLCQFFANSSRRVAPLVSQSLFWVGAEAHRALYDGFLEKNGIDAMDLRSFQSETVEQFLDQYKRYPFREFDSAYYDLLPLQDYIAPFIRKNIALF